MLEISLEPAYLAKGSTLSLLRPTRDFLHKIKLSRRCIRCGLVCKLLVFRRTMPRSKRAKVVHLSKVEKKPIKASNRASAEKIQEYATKYPYIYVLSVNNMRNQALKDVRTELSDSRSVLPLLSSFTTLISYTSLTN